MTNSLLGGWRLRSFDLTTNQVDWAPWGEDLSGILIFSENGLVSVSINRNSGRDFDITEDTLFYAGRYEVSGAQIRFHVENATDSKRVGQTLIRDWVLEANQITLRGTAPSGKAFRLTWAR